MEDYCERIVVQYESIRLYYIIQGEIKAEFMKNVFSP